MLPPVTLKAALELSPLSRTSVPPDKTGLAPTELKPTLVPLEIVETLVLPEDEPELLEDDPEPPLELQTLQAEMSKFQISDVGVVCVNTKV